MEELCFNRLFVKTDDIHVRMKIIRWLFQHYRVYNYEPSKQAVRARFITCKPFPLDALRKLTDTLDSDSSLYLRIISTDLYTSYVESNIYYRGQWTTIFRSPKR